MSDNQNPLNPQPETNDPETTGKISAEDFAKRIKTKYPGKYDDVDDLELARRTVRKMPGYLDRVEMGADFSLRVLSSGNNEYDSLYEAAAREHNLDVNLLLSQGDQESKYKPEARSHKDAVGIAQFLADTAREFGLRVDNEVDERKDPKKAIPAQARMMRWLLDRHNGDVDLALAAYNSGHRQSSEQARRAMERIAETKDYVAKIGTKYRGTLGAPGTGASAGAPAAPPPAQQYQSNVSAQPHEGKKTVRAFNPRTNKWETRTVVNPSPASQSEADGLAARDAREHGNQPAQQPQQNDNGSDGIKKSADQSNLEPGKVRLEYPDGPKIVATAQKDAQGNETYSFDPMERFFGSDSLASLRQPTIEAGALGTLRKTQNQEDIAPGSTRLQNSETGVVYEAPTKKTAQGEVYSLPNQTNGVRPLGTKSQLEARRNQSNVPFSLTPEVETSTRELLRAKGVADGDAEKVVELMRSNPEKAQEIFTDLNAPTGTDSPEAAGIVETGSEVPETIGQTPKPAIRRKDLGGAGYIQEPLVDISNVPEEQLEEHLFRKSLEAIASGFGITEADIDAEIRDRRNKGKGLLDMSRLAGALEDTRKIGDNKVPVAIDGLTIKNIQDRRAAFNEVDARDRLVEQEKNQEWYETAGDAASRAVDKTVGVLQNPVGAMYRAGKDLINGNFAPDMPTTAEQRADEAIKESGGSAIGEEDRRDRVARMSWFQYGAAVAGHGAKSLLDPAASIAQSFGAIQRSLMDLALYKPAADKDEQVRLQRIRSLTANDETSVQTLGAAVRSWIDENVPANSDVKNAFATKLTTGVTSAASFMLIGSISAGVGVSSKLASGLFGALMESGSTYDSLVKQGLDKRSAAQWSNAGLPIGALELFGIGRHLDRVTGGMFSRQLSQFLAEAGKEATEEALQEFVQGAAGSLLMKQAMAKDPSLRERLILVYKSLPEALKEGKEGALVGALVGGGMVGAREIPAEVAKRLPGAESVQETALETETHINSQLEELTKLERLQKQTENKPNVSPDTKAKLQRDIENLRAATAGSNNGASAPVATEKPETLDAQRVAMADPNSSRMAVLYTDTNSIPADMGEAALSEMPFDTDQGIIFVNPMKARAALGLNSAKQIEQFIAENGFEPLLGIVSPVEDTTGGAALITRDAKGTELVSAIVDPNNPQAVAAQAAEHAAQFLAAAASQEITDAQLVVEERQTENGNGDKKGIRRRVAEFVDPTLTEELNQERERRETAERAAETDELTGVANRKAYDKAILSAEKDPETSVIAFDANNFGKINKMPEHGQFVGDRALQQIAKALKQAATENGVGTRVFRRGGDEFVILAPAEKAEAIRQRAEQLFGDQKFDGTFNGKPESVTVSVSGSVGNTFDEADSVLQERKARRKAAQAESVKQQSNKISEQTSALEQDEGEKNDLLANKNVGEIATGFKTAKGSTYLINGQSTQRNKSFHPEHGKEDVGQKEPSEVTYYSDDLNAIGMNGSLQGVQKGVYVTEENGQKIAYPVSWNEQQNNWGMSPADRAHPATLSDKPEIGKKPLELWKAKPFGQGVIYSNWHPGNEIVEITKAGKLPTSNQKASSNGAQASSARQKSGARSETVADDLSKKAKNLLTSETNGQNLPESTQSDPDKFTDSISETISPERATGTNLQPLKSQERAEEKPLLDSAREELRAAAEAERIKALVKMSLTRRATSNNVRVGDNIRYPKRLGVFRLISKLGKQFPTNKKAFENSVREILARPVSQEELRQARITKKSESVKSGGATRGDSKKHTLFEYVLYSGGLDPSRGIDLSALQGLKIGIRPLVHRGGANPEDAFKDAISSGYLPEYAFETGGAGDGNNSATGGINAFIESIAESARFEGSRGNNPHYSTDNQAYYDLLEEINTIPGALLDEVLSEAERIARFLSDREISRMIQQLEQTGELSDADYTELADTLKDYGIEIEQIEEFLLAAAGEYNPAEETGSRESIYIQNAESLDKGLTARGEIGESESGENPDEEIDESEPETVSAEDLEFNFGENEDSDTSATDGAHEAATSPTNNLPEPSQAQKEAGNYKKGHISINGLNITVENPVNSERKGVDRDGKKWAITMQHHYGYIKRSIGADTENLDIFVKDKTPADFSGEVFIVDQVHPDNGKFDEHKIMLGFSSEAEAREAYLSNYAKDWKGLKNITAMAFAEFKKWASEEQNAPVADKKSEKVDNLSISDTAPHKNEDSGTYKNESENSPKWETDLFGNDLAPTTQTDLFGKSELTNLKNESSKNEKAELVEAYGEETANYIHSLAQNPDKDIERVARDLKDARKLVAAKGEDARAIVEAAADALDVFVTARQQKGNVSEIINQPRLDQKAISPEAETYARAMESGRFAGIFNNDLSNAKSEKPEKMPAKSDESVLRQNRSSNAQKRMSDVRHLPTGELIGRMEFARNNGYLVELNAEAHEFIRRAWEDNRIAEQGKNAKAEAPFDAAFVTPEGIAKTVSRLETIHKRAVELNYPAAQVKKIEDLRKAIIEAGESGKTNAGKTAILYVYDDALSHEEFHRAGFSAALGKALAARHGRFNELVGSIAYKKAFKNFLNRFYTPEQTAVLVEETAAWIASGHREKLGLTEDEALDYLDLWFESFADANGVEALENFDAVKEQRIYEAIRKVRESRRNNERNAGERELRENGTLNGESPQPESPQGNPPPAIAPGGSESREEITEPAASELHDEAAEALTGEPKKDRENKNRRFAESLRESGRDAADVAYIPKTFEEWMQRAGEHINSAGLEQSVKDFFSDAVDRDLRPALGIQLYDHLASLGETAVADRVAEHLTNIIGEAAQMVVAARIINKYSPKSAVLFADKMKFKATGEHLTEEQKQKIRDLSEYTRATAEEKALATERARELENRSKKTDQEIAGLESALKDAENKAKSRTGDLEDAERKIRNLEAALRRAKKEKADVDRSVRQSRANRELLAKLREQKSDLADRLSKRFNKAVEEVLKQILDSGFDIKTETPEFKRWFGNSKVVDENGNPLVVYHGTNRRFEVFDVEKTGSRTDEGWFGKGAYFTPIRKNAERYAKIKKPIIVEAYLRIETPYIINPQNQRQQIQWDNSSEAREYITSRGYDGVLVYRDFVDGTKNNLVEVVAFEPNQIKSVFNEGAFSRDDNSILRQNAQISAIAPLEDDVINDLIDWATVKLLEKLPTGEYSLADFDAELTNLTNGEINGADIRRIHAAAINRIYPEGGGREQSESAQKRAKNTAEHKKAAKNFSAGEDIKETAEPEKTVTKTKETEPTEKTEKTEKSDFSKEKESPFDLTMLDTADAQDYSDETVLSAAAWSETKNLRDWRKLMRERNEDISDDELVQLFKNSQSLLRDTRAAMERALAERKAEKKLTDEEFAAARNRERAARAAAGKARADANNFYNALSQSRTTKAVNIALDLINIPRGLMLGADASYTFRQGLFGFISHPKESLKAFFDAFYRGALTEKGYFDLIEEIRDAKEFKELQRFGAEFLAASDVEYNNEYHLSNVVNKLPVYKQTQRLFEAQHDAQVANIGKNMLREVRRSGYSIEDQNKALEYLLGKYLNSSTGKGMLFKSVFRDPVVMKAAGVLGNAPRFWISRFETVWHLSGGILTAPPAARRILVRDAARVASVMTIPLALLGALGFVNFDPEDKEFLQFRYKDFKMDFSGGTTEQGRWIALSIKAAIYAARGDYDGVNRVWSNWFEDLPRYFEGKSSPFIGMIREAFTGYDFVGRPSTAWSFVTSRFVPVMSALTFQQAGEVWNYDRSDARMREADSFEKFKENLQKTARGENNKNASVTAATFFLNAVGFGTAVFPKDEKTTALREAQSLMPHYEQDREVSRIKGGLSRRLRDGEPVETIRAEALEYRKKGVLSEKQVENILESKDVAPIVSATKNFDDEKIEQVLKYATDEERQQLAPFQKLKEARKLDQSKPTDDNETKESELAEKMKRAGVNLAIELFRQQGAKAPDRDDLLVILANKADNAKKKGKLTAQEEGEINKLGIKLPEPMPTMKSLPSMKSEFKRELNPGISVRGITGK